MSALAELLGESPEIAALRRTVERLLQHQRAAAQFPPILVEGETGTGKGMLASAIHRAGARSSGPFIDVNCAAIPETLMEAELFGFERGAFTDAREAKAGIFQTAHGGTIFLDEVGLLPEALQRKLLKVIEDRAVRRLGATRSQPLDVWIVTATNEDLGAAVRERRFRADLYHRLAVVTLRLPPLRDRAGDILTLAEHFLVRACREYDLSPRTFTADARAALLAHAWPGNVRELANVVERVALLGESDAVTAAMLGLATPTPLAPRPPAPASGERPLGEVVVSVEREHLLQALQQTDWNLSRAAAQLGLPRNTLRYRMTRLGLAREAAAPGARHQTAATPAVAAPGRRVAPGPVEDQRLELQRRTVATVRVGLAPGVEAGSVAEWSRLLALVADRLGAFGGRIEEMTGNGCAALFGLDPVEDAARRAAAAATAIRRSIERRGPDEITSHHVRIAVEVATVTLVRVGQSWELDPSARREVLDAVEDLLGAARPGDIVTSEAALPFVERRFEVTRTPERTPRGRPLVRLTGTERSGYERWGRATTFVGRREELETLQALLSSAGEGHGRVVKLVGEPGAGKSRLVRELRGTAMAARVRWLETACPSHGTSVPFLAVTTLLRELLDIGEEMVTEVVSAKMRATLAGLGEGEALEPPLLSLLGRLPAAHPFTVLSPAQRCQQVVDAVARLVLAACRSQAVGLVVEDLQWVDRETRAVLDAIVTAAPTTRLLFIATCRPEYGHGWTAIPGFVEIQLGPLSAVSVGAMLNDLLGTDASLAPVKRLLVEKVDGNPFYLEECVWSLVEDRVLSGHPGSYQFTGHTLDLTPPATVQAVLAGRVGRLPPRRRFVLQCAAVAGRSVPWPLLRLLTELDEDSLRDELAHLRAAALLRDASVSADVCEFKHALTQDVVYGTLPTIERTRLHGKVLEAMEQFWPRATADHADVLAAHAMQGEIWHKAVDYLRLAGAKAYSSGALAEAVRRYEQALALIPRLPASVESARRAIDVRLDLHAPLMTMGRTQQITELYPEAERLARELGDGLRLGQVLQRMSQIAWLGGRYRMGAEYAQHALAVASEASDPITRLHANYFLGLHRHALGDYRGAIPCFSWIVDGPDAEIARHVVSVTVPLDIPAFCWLAFAHVMTGDPRQAEATLQRGLAAAEASMFPQALVIARTIQGVILLHEGRPEAALAPLEGAVALCERIGFIVWLAGAYSTLGIVLARCGRPAEGLPHLERGVVSNEKTGVRTYQAQRYGWWAEGLLRAGRIDDARTRAEMAIELARTMEERGVQAEAILLRGGIARAEGQPEQARAWFEQALQASATLGARPFEAHAHLGLGGTLNALGEPAAADHLATAATMFREMGIEPWWRGAWPGEPLSP